MKGISRLPAPLIGFARLARSTALRVWGPIDRLFRGPELRRLPPLWLRRHVGPIAKFSSSARETGELISRLSLLEQDDLVLDVGCGAGAMAVEFQRALGPHDRYLGFDVHAPSIRWCRERFASDPRLRFELAKIQTPYSRRFRGRAGDFRFPAADRSCGFVLAKSLFTHLLAPEAEAYLREIARVLLPNRRALVTALLFDPEAEVPAFPFSGETGEVRWKVRRRPQAAVAFSRTFFESLASAAGLRIDQRIDGFFPGTDGVPSGQDILILRPEPEAELQADPRAQRRRPPQT
jgi:SAM-dependent methyltransferase